MPLTLFVLLTLSFNCTIHQEADRPEDDLVWSVIRELDRSTITLRLTSGVILPHDSVRFQTDHLVEYFQSELIQEELDIADTQKKPFLKIVDKWKEEIEEIKNQVYQVGSSNQLTKDQRKKLIEKSKTVSDKYLVEIEEVLLPHQLSRLKKIQVKVLLKTVGPYAFLMSPRVREKIGLTNEQSSSLYLAKQKGLIEARAIIKKRLPKLIEEVIDGLSEQQKKQFSNRWPTLGQGTEPWIGVLAYQCSREFLERSRRVSKVSPLDQVLKLPMFYVKYNGQAAHFTSEITSYQESLVLLKNLLKEP